MAKKTVTKFGEKSINTIIRQVQDYRKRTEKSQPPANDLRTDVINACFLIHIHQGMSWHCHLFVPRPGFPWSRAKVKPKNPVRLFIERLNELGYDGSHVDDVIWFKISDSVNMGLSGRRDDYMVITMTNKNEAGIMCDYDPLRAIKPDEDADAMKRNIESWLAMEADVLAEIDATIEKIGKRDKISEVSSTTTVGVIAMRMEQEGLGFEYRTTKLFTEVQVDIPDSRIGTCVTFKVRNNHVAEDIDKALEVIRFVRQMLSKGYDGMYVGPRVYKNFKPWEG